MKRKNNRRRALPSRQTLITLCFLALVGTIGVLSFFAGRSSVNERQDQQPAAMAYLKPDMPTHTYYEQEQAALPVVEEEREAGRHETWRENAVPFDVNDPRPKIVIILDDMGVNSNRSREAMDLPAPMTFAFLPYARNVNAMVEQARDKGHEIMVHVAMQPDNTLVDPGPLVLKETMTEQELTSMLRQNLSVFDGYVGFNNHMGSLLTRDQKAMESVMAVARDRGLLFIDSKTTEDSVAGTMAKAFGVPTADRDVFLDHDEDFISVERSLEKVERIARRNGHAVAIGHPKEHTLEALRRWLPTLEEKGFILAPASAVVSVPLPAAGN